MTNKKEQANVGLGARNIIVTPNRLWIILKEIVSVLLQLPSVLLVCT